MHEVLGPYLAEASPPTVVSAPTGTKIRFPVEPAGAIPLGLRPIPATTQSNKKTNAQIPYARTASTTQDVGGRSEPSAREGAIAFVERQPLVPRVGIGVNACISVYSVEQVNARIKALRPDAFEYDLFPYRLDGVVNNVDGADELREFKDHTIVNMAVQGVCRLDHRETFRADERVSKPSTTIYVGLFGKKEMDTDGTLKWTHVLERFSSAMISRKLINLGDNTGKRTLLFAWTVGRVVDCAPSKDMLSVHVDVRPLLPFKAADVRRDQAVNDGSGTKRYVLRWNLEGTTPQVFGDEVKDMTVKEILEAFWVV
jgi:hypothetical protein